MPYHLRANLLIADIIARKEDKSKSAKISKAIEKGDQARSLTLFYWNPEAIVNSYASIQSGYTLISSIFAYSYPEASNIKFIIPLVFG